MKNIYNVRRQSETTAKTDLTQQKGVADMEPNKQAKHTSPANEISQAIFVVNKHAKAAPKPKILYDLKQSAIQKLLKEGKAKKLGLHYSDNPRNAQQHSDVIVQCGEYIFHLPPSKEDIRSLPHLGSRQTGIRNPKTYMSLSRAKAIIYNYIGANKNVSHGCQAAQDSRPKTKRIQQKNTSNIFTSSFLGRH